MKSLRARALVGGFLTAAVIIALGFTALWSLADQQSNQSFRDLLPAVGVVTLIGVVGALLQVTLVLQPLNTLRSDVLRCCKDEGGLNVGEYPTEIAPLVTDINTLVERNREIWHQSRQQAADLAHAIKIPSAIVRNELEMLDRDGMDVQVSIDALNRLDAQLNRSFARVRADGSQTAMPVFTDVSTALDRMIRAITGLAHNVKKDLSSEIAEGLRIRMDQSDFEEVMGNLLDNALKWAKSTLHVTATLQGDMVLIKVEDDGPGIAEADIAMAVQSGLRLDTARPGTGLGLAIVNDLVRTYSGELVLGRSDGLAGLCATVGFKSAQGEHPR
jgi:signal transduction histidine kinase